MNVQLPTDLQVFMLEQEVSRRERLIRDAKADPVKHKATLQFDGRLGWRYFGDIVSRGKRYRYAFTTTRNAAGYFLSFREVVNLKRGTGLRDQITASKTRSICKERARARYKRHKASSPNAK